MTTFAKASVQGYIAGPISVFQQYGPDGRLRLDKTGRPMTRATISLAVNSSFKKADGTKGQPDYITIVVWGEKRVLNILNYCPKGTMLTVHGRLSGGGKKGPDGKYRRWDNVTAQEVSFGQRSQAGQSLTVNPYKMYQPATKTFMLVNHPLVPQQPRVQRAAVGGGIGVPAAGIGLGAAPAAAAPALPPPPAGYQYARLPDGNIVLSPIANAPAMGTVGGGVRVAGIGM